LTGLGVNCKHSKADCEVLKELNYYKQIYNELKLILDTTYDEIVIADGKGVILRVSKSCEKSFGIPEEEMIGVSAKVLERKGILSKSTAVYVAKHKKRVTLAQTTKSGRRLIVTGIPMFDENGELIRIISISRDVTEFENLKNQLRETEEMLNFFREEMNSKHARENQEIIASSKAMQEIITRVKQVANYNVIVLLTGETGVGKSLIAKTIHQMSERRQKPFVQVNCGAIPESLLESELFGYVEGAFTGASKSGKKGLFEAANEGTLFLDEISEIPLNLQVKLLHAIENSEITKIGETMPTKVDARIVVATNKNLKKLVEKGGFREDLYYRLNVVPIYIPPLRERKEDIPVLIHHFVQKFNRKYGLNKSIAEEGFNLLTSYDWPGNIRQLENTIERLIITSQNNLLDKHQILNAIGSDELIDTELRGIMPLKKAREIVEARIIREALNIYKTTRKVAKVLEVDQSTIVKKIHKYGLLMD